MSKLLIETINNIKYVRIFATRKDRQKYSFLVLLSEYKSVQGVVSIVIIGDLGSLILLSIIIFMLFMFLVVILSPIHSLLLTNP